MSRLVNFKFRNFQRIHDELSIPFDKLVLFCGPNSAGKSTLIDALSVMKRKLKELLTETSWDFFAWHNFTMTAEIEFDYQRAIRDYGDEETEFTKWYRYSETWEYFFRELHERHLSIELSGDNLSIALDGETIFVLRSLSLVTLRNGDPDLPIDVEGYRLRTGTGSWKLADEGLIDVDDEQRSSGNYDSESRIYLEVSDKIDWVGSSELKSIGRNEVGRIYGPFEYFRAGKLEGSIYVDHFGSFIEGVVLAILDAEWPSHVSDDRSILRSRELILDDYDLNRVYGRTEYPDLNSLLSAYVDKYAKSYSKPAERVSFANHVLEHHMPSFGLQRVVLESQEVSSTFFNPYSGKELDSDGDACRFLGRSANRYRFWVATSKENDSDFHLRGLEEVGSGFSYVLPFLIALDLCKVSIVQQPELHLHPAAQCELGDALIAGFNRGSGVVVETHSEHLILRLLRRIRETRSSEELPNELRIEPEEVRIFYFDPDGESLTLEASDKLTRVHEIRIDSYGEFLDPWPKGFFAERDAEIFGS